MGTISSTSASNVATRIGRNVEVSSRRRSAMLEAS